MGCCHRWKPTKDSSVTSPMLCPVDIDKKASMIISVPMTRPSRSGPSKVNVWPLCWVTMFGFPQVRSCSKRKADDDSVTIISAGNDKMVKAWNLNQFQIELTSSVTTPTSTL
ncbi:CGH_1_HP_G0103910.mRNA.1.CDS.1 [Saccharomyces cerevisiae]|nr:CGH_1_HP_G0103910.mRNA.1.CDS.1 [Saccharomyces cerevisiae]CAI6951106.1 CGH_1_HP_G0103910.mRNA.1.CDS.1 [Saccharomyces cerevisiae]